MEDKKDILKTVTRLAQAGEWVRVIKEYEKLMDMDPGDINLHNSMGEALAKLGEFRKAFEHFQIVLNDYQAKGNSSKIMFMYKKISKLDPRKFDLDGKALYEKISKIVNAISCYDSGDAEAAITALKEAEKYDKYNSEILIKLGEMCEKKNLIGESIEAYTKAIRVLVEKNKKDEAIIIARKVLEMDKENTDAMAMIADDLISSGHKDKAEEIFKDLLITLAEKEKIAEGREIAKRAMDLDIEYGKQFYAYFLFKENKMDEAKKVLESAYELTTEEKVLLGKIHFKLYEYDRAKAVLMSMDPEVVNQNVEILELIGDSLLKMREYKQAAEYYLKALKIEKQEGRYDEAIIMANKVMNVETENVELHEIMAEIYTRKSMKAKVIDEYTKLSNLYEKHGRIEDAIKIRQVLSKIKMI
jgi:tetratricopeptide (TPR) repeat protein